MQPSQAMQRSLPDSTRPRQNVQALCRISPTFQGPGTSVTAFTAQALHNACMRECMPQVSLTGTVKAPKSQSQQGTADRSCNRLRALTRMWKRSLQSCSTHSVQWWEHAVLAMHVLELTVRQVPLMATLAPCWMSLRLLCGKAILSWEKSCRLLTALTSACP